MPTTLTVAHAEAAREGREQGRTEKLIEVMVFVRSGMTVAEAAAVVEVDIDDDTRFPALSPNRVGFIPTPDQIAAACREIQSGWTDVERRNREVVKSAGQWAVPTISTREIGAA